MKKAIMFSLSAGLLLMLVACGPKSSKKVSREMETAQKIAKLEQDINSRQDQMNQLLQKYMQEGGKDLSGLMGKELTPEQRQLLEKRLKSEEGIGYKDLISDILAKQKNIDDLKVQIQNMEKTLPAPVVVKKGETQYDIAMNYLMKEKGLSKDQARKLALRVNLMDDLVPGFKVWNFYDNGVYGTFVTQGTANISPYRLQQLAKQKLVNAKNEAITQRDQLQQDKTSLMTQVSDLQNKRDQLNQELTLLQSEKEDMIKRLGDMQNLSEDLKARLNSVFYAVGDRHALIKSGLVKDPFFGHARLTKFDEASYPEHVDLRSNDSITFTAKQAGVESIHKIKIAPSGVFKEGQDYTASITDGGQTATIKLNNKDKFKAERTIAILVN
ncbi:MAG: hypothetical protein P8Z49_00815 [Acidobacteriota bacterium]